MYGVVDTANNCCRADTCSMDGSWSLFGNAPYLSLYVFAMRDHVMVSIRLTVPVSVSSMTWLSLTLTSLSEPLTALEPGLSGENAVALGLTALEPSSSSTLAAMCRASRPLFILPISTPLSSRVSVVTSSNSSVDEREIVVDRTSWSQTSLGM